MYTNNYLKPPSGHVFSQWFCAGVVLNRPIPTTAAEDEGNFTLEFELVPLSNAVNVSNLEVMLELMNGTAGKLNHKCRCT